MIRFAVFSWSLVKLKKFIKSYESFFQKIIICMVLTVWTRVTLESQTEIFDF